MKAIFNESDGVKRMTGYTTTEYQSDISGQALVETTEGDLVTVFEEAKNAGETLDGSDASIGEAVEDPLSFRSYLILVDGTIEFDADYVRETQPSDQTSA